MVAGMLEKMLFGTTGYNSIEVRSQSDSEPPIRTLGSTRRVENKTLIPNVKRIKEMMRRREVTRIKFVQTNKNLSDLLTKWKTFSQEFSDVFRRGILEQHSSRVEIRLIPRQTGDKLRIFKHGELEREEAQKDVTSIS